MPGYKKGEQRCVICSLVVFVMWRETLSREHRLLALPARYGGPWRVRHKQRRLPILFPGIPQLFFNELFAPGKHSTSTTTANFCLHVTFQAGKSCNFRADATSRQLMLEHLLIVQRTLSRIVKGNAICWLTVLPLRQESYDLFVTQF